MKISRIKKKSRQRKSDCTTLCLLLLLLTMAGCSYSLKMTYPDRSSLEQLLLVRSLERAAAQLNLAQFTGNRVFFEIHGLTGDKDFAKEFLENEFEKQGATLVSDKSEADLRMNIIMSALGLNSSETLFGTPAFVLPIGITFPEIAIYKSIRNVGYTEIKIDSFDSKTNTFLTDKSPQGIGKSKYNNYRLLLIFSFTKTDIDEKQSKPEAENEVKQDKSRKRQ
jgi:hypothetical protein